MEAVKYQPGDFSRFLKKFKTIKRSSFTHTSISNPAGSFYVPKDHEAEFFTLYRKAMAAKEPLHLTEKHHELSPVLIDIDLRFRGDSGLTRKYTEEDLEVISSTYVQALRRYADIDTASVFVMEKSGPCMHQNLVKDGIHMVIPDVVTRPCVQYLVRQNVLEQLRPVFEKMGATNAITDIIDERVIDINNWQMYGSCKPGGEPYRVTGIHRYTDGKLTHDTVGGDLVETLSIRNKYRESALKMETLKEVEDYEERMYAEREKKKQMCNAMQKNRNTKKNEYTSVGLVDKLVGILNHGRANNYNDWMRVGWCLRNIDHRLLQTWINFSKNSDKFVDGECDRVWDYMRDDGLGIGTLHMWAKQDSPKEYADIISKDLFELIKTSMNKTHYDVAKVVHHMYEHQFVCTSVKSKGWFEFKNHRWMVSENGFSLRNKISNEVFCEYMKAAGHYNILASTAAADEQSVFADKAKKLHAIGELLKNTSFKENIMKECADMFYRPKFEEELLDSNLDLLGFENGVLDLTTIEFREGRPEDYISLTTGINYREFNENDNSHREVSSFLAKVLTRDDIREYVLKVLASCLDGHNREEKFYIWTGVGANGKSKMLELMMKTFGDYYCIMNVTAITGKRVSSNGTNSELVQTKGKRMVVMQEPGEDEKMNIGYLKELSGGDTVKGRGLFKEPIEFKPQFKMILTCNHLPTVPSATDDGTWRRIRVAEFTSRFVENPDPNHENEFQIDRELSMRFEGWKEAFMAMLVEYYKKYREEGIGEPDEVMKCTREYQKSNDVISEYFDDRLEKADDEVIGLLEVFEDFKDWVRRFNPNYKVGRRKELYTYLDKHIGKPVKLPKAGYRGYRLKKMAMIEDDMD